MHASHEFAPYGHMNPYPIVITGICAVDWKLEYAKRLQDFLFPYILSTFQTILLRFSEGSECEIVQRVEPFGRHRTLVFN